MTDIDSSGLRKVRGTRAILQHLERTYGAGGLLPGTIVVIALDTREVMLGQARLRDIEPDVEPCQMALVVAGALRPLVADPRGAATDSVLLAVFRRGPDGPQECDLAWWSALVSACAEVGLDAAEAIVSTPSRWHTFQAGTRGHR